MKPGRMPSRYAVRAAIAASLRQGGASLQHTANQLGVSARSLQRHLGEMGTSYRDMVAEVRLDAACRLLVESNAQILDIALCLGYAGASSFSRTFMRLMKIQPIIYRRQQRNDKARPSTRARLRPAGAESRLARNGKTRPPNWRKIAR
jgi:AraC-like DNA-binding protein